MTEITPEEALAMAIACMRREIIEKDMERRKEICDKYPGASVAMGPSPFPYLKGIDDVSKKFG